MKKFNIYHRRDGRWEGRITQEKQNGKRKYKYFFGYSKEEVILKMKRSLENDNNFSDISKTMTDIYKEWAEINSNRIKRSTAANYSLKAQKHIIPYFKNISAASISSAMIQKFIEQKFQQGLSGRYISDILILLKSLFKYAVKTYHISDPTETVCMPKIKKPDIEILNDEEQARLQKYISENKNRSTLGVALSMATGLRIGELCALQWEDIDIKKRILTVRKTIQRIQTISGKNKTEVIITEPKSESSKRMIPVPKCMIPLLAEFKSGVKDYVLSGTEKAVEPRTMQYRFANILKKNSLPSVHFHALRHIFASNAVRAGFDIKALSEILGHSGVEITLNRYVHSSFEQKIKYIDLLNIGL